MATFLKRLRLAFIVIWLVVLMGLGGGNSIVLAEKSEQFRPETPGVPQAMGLNYEWHTFYGVADSTFELRSVAVDADGNAYVAGYSSKTWGSPLHAYSGGYDLIVIKLNSKGDYLWHTFYGSAPDTSSNGDDQAAGIALDTQGNLYVTGYSDKSWQGDGAADPLNPPSVGEAMFVLKLDKDGAYLWHTFYQTGRARAIVTDSSNNVYISGVPGLSRWGAPLHDSSNGNIYIMKLDSRGAYQWHTYYGAGSSAEEESPYGMAVDPNSGAVYITGQTPNSWLGDADEPPLHAFSGGSGYSVDLFALKLSGAGAYQWHTFYGVDGYDDTANDVGVDSQGSAYLVGYSSETWGSPLHAKAGGDDLFALKLNSSGAYQWNTFYGSNGDGDRASGIVIDSSDNAYIAGIASATWQGDNGADPVHPYSGGGSGDILVLKLSSAGAYRLHTFYGADSSYDEGFGIALGPQNSIYTTGLSQTTWNGLMGAVPRYAHSGTLAGDGFVLKLSNHIYNIYLPVAVNK